MTIREMKDFKADVKTMSNDTLMEAYAKHLCDYSRDTRDWERKNAIFETEIQMRWGN